jgi:hypothetical protein
VAVAADHLDRDVAECARSACLETHERLERGGTVLGREAFRFRGRDHDPLRVARPQTPERSVVTVLSRREVHEGARLDSMRLGIHLMSR